MTPLVGAKSELLAIAGGVIIDGNGGAPLDDGVVVIGGGRIISMGRADTAIPEGAVRIDAHGKYVIPGLMDANVHLLGDVRPENLIRHLDHYEELIAEAAQVALKYGLTTVFDTWGPRRPLMAVRDRIAAGEIPGSRIVCAGNIVGFDGPFSQDFLPKALETTSPALVKRINAMWVENVGRHLMWLPPDRVAKEVRNYIGRGIDFVKYASNDHFPGAFLAFSPQVQLAIVEEAHRAGITAQAHALSVEGLRVAVESGCDLIQHANLSGPVPIPEATLELIARRKTGMVVFPLTERRLQWFMEKADEASRCVYAAIDVNARNLIECGAQILMAWDSHILAPEAATDPVWFWAASADDSPHRLGEGHFVWFKAMEEKACPPMQMLQAATRNIAVAYGKNKDLGTLEPGKIADLLILDKNPLQAAENYRSIHMIIKDGAIVDRDDLPTQPILTKPAAAPVEEEDRYVPFLSGAKLPMCPLCVRY